MTVKQITSWLALLQHYFISLCHNISFYVHRLGLLASSKGGHANIANGECKKVDSCQTHRHFNDSKKKQTLSKVKYKRIWEIPGPKCWPLVGTFLQFKKYGISHLHDMSADYHQKYGDMFRDKLFSQDLVFLASLDLMKEWMSQEGRFPVSTKQETSRLLLKSYSHIPRGVFWNDGEKWASTRKIAIHILLKNGADFYTDGLYDACEAWIAREMNLLAENVCKGESNGWINDIQPKCYYTIIGLLMTVVCGFKHEDFHAYTGTTVDDLARLAREINVHHSELLEMPAGVAKWLGVSAWKNYEEKTIFNLEVVMGFIKRLQSEVSESPNSTSLRTHGLLYKTVQMKGDPTEILGVLADFTVDSKDSAAVLFMYVYETLGTHPEIQDKIYEEVTRVYGDEPITYGKHKSLEYTEGFFLEIIRLHPAAPFASRVAQTDTFIGGYHIPRNTIISYATYVVNRDPRYFANPLKLWPERWAKQNGVKEGTNGTRASITKICEPSAFAVFGLGSRACLGEAVTISLFKLYIANLVRHFKVTSTKWPKPHMRTVLYPAETYPIHLEIRQTSKAN